MKLRQWISRFRLQVFDAILANNSLHVFEEVLLDMKTPHMIVYISRS
jgi:hypothetical protein